jgi:serine/threonine-protein kinase
VTRELTEVRQELTSLSEKVEKEYDEGNRYYKEKEFDTAISHFKNAIDLVPGIPSLYLSLGKSYSASHQYNDAVATYERGVKVAKQKEKVYVDLIAHRGSAKESLGYHQEAIDDLSLAIKLSPDDADAYYNRGIAKYELNDFPGAVADYTAAIKLDPNDARAYYNRGVVKIMLNDFQGAIADSTATIKLNPDHADAYYNRGVAKSRLNDLPGAIADYTAAINLGPNLEDAYEARGSAHTALRNEKEAADDFRRAMELRLKSSQASATH